MSLYVYKEQPILEIVTPFQALFPSAYNFVPIPFHPIPSHPPTPWNA